ncbi:coxsackievirus and adenovirus receptor isoform X3 [Hemicordylus capensis]|uniref:coxsackievirus and adenovirus receptor isoform X3 n=1 Tax=Hemicordylus capensis TaxID=884348 RepID=UPI00230375CC|nr:coxsackievirus and adenovirus receptor isoform X3 [Hemicordylus capensis]
MKSSPPLLLLLHLFGSLLFFCADLSEGVSISREQTMETKAQGEKVNLLCIFTVDSGDVGPLDIEWVIVQPNGEEIVIMYNADRVYDSYGMSGRVQFVNQNPAAGDGSIEILNLQPTDTGTYQCKVKKLPGFQIHRVQLTVLAKPSKTKCSVHGSQEIGSDVTLKCISQEGSPIINYEWKKTTGTEELPTTSLLNGDTGDLLLKNASQAYSGTYRCTASNKVGHDDCFLLLNVTPPTNRAGTIAGAIIGTLLGLLLLAFFIFCCCKKQREKKYEKEVHHDIREDVPPPKSRASTARSYIGSNRSSLGSMSPSNMDGYAKTQYNKVPSEDFERTPTQNPNFQPPKLIVHQRFYYKIPWCLTTFLKGATDEGTQTPQC